MSLLLDARRKIQQAQSAQQDDAVAQASSPAAESADEARNAGQNLFAAKVPPRVAGHALPNRNLLYALGGTILLLALGAAYFWYLDFAGSIVPQRPVSARPVQVALPATPTVAPAAQAVAETAAPDTAHAIAQALPLVRAAASVPAEAAQERSHAAARREMSPRPPSSPLKIEQPDGHGEATPDDETRHARFPLPNPPPGGEGADVSLREFHVNAGQVAPQLMDAYQAYRDGRLDEAQRQYLELLAKDADHPDVLLGLASIALRRGKNQAAAHYFGRVLALDPRNAAANAGMAALSADQGFSESRLKILLREQGNAAVLHFALGNLYAAQTRWSEAQQAYFNAYTLEQGNAEFAFNLAVSLDHLGQKKLAAQHYRRAMQLDAAHGAGFDHAQAALRAQDLER